MASLLLLRHGQIRANRKGLWHGSTDSSLNWRGRRQAQKTARHLTQTHPTLATIYTSPLERCRHTAEAVRDLTGIAIEPVRELREYGIGDWEGLPFNQLSKEHDFVGRSRANPDFAPPGGETLNEVASRTVAAIRDIHERHIDDEQVLIVSHGVSLAVALSCLLDEDPARWTDYPLANCSLTELVLSPSPYVNFFNSTQHL